ncbi:S-type pyocin domain-containing protein [Pseudomonas sp. Teo4]|uniref:S-type pyocin domain-containing protein n=1 Tax=Pseudomonas sp. Teo4 TaxID=3064528 RepID=UPI002AB83035|nr:S-type pyocin domain-containing protein [Pseudomonas sp. Teo4]MDZ3992537.1 hypothetical protein [Pseudomonas sp. Teo4]
MAKNILGDNSTGDVVITPGSSGSSGGGGGFFSIGGGGGFGGGFGSSSQRRRKKRARARAAALAQAKAAEQARQAAAAAARAEAMAQAHRQRVDAYSQAREGRRTQLDAHFTGQAKGLAQALQNEINAARKVPNYDGSERWQLYQITKARNETLGLIAAKQLERAQRQALANAFADVGMAADAYAKRLASLTSTEQMQQLHRDWEAAYVAAQDARLLGTAIEQLTQRAAALAAEHVQQGAQWRATEARWARERQYAEQREARVRFKQQADEDRRLQRLKETATLAAPVAAAPAGGVLLSQAGAQVAVDLAAVIGQAITDAFNASLRARLLALRRGGITVNAMLYSPILGNGELTDAQRRRHLEGLGVRADLLGVAPGQNLQAIANAGGSARLSHRIKIEHLPGGSAIAVTSTGEEVKPEVRVRNGIFDPVTETYRVAAETPTGKSIVLGSAAVPGEAPAGGRMLALVPEATAIGAGVDLRFDDCIVCIPGQPPQYFSFTVPPAGTGIVSGKGQVADSKWWSASAAATGVAVPAQVGNQLRGRVFTGLPAFESAVWRAVGADLGLLGQFDELNQRRILSGFPPIAPKASWRGARREFELRHAAPAGVGSGLYNLDQLRIHKPANTQGVLTVVQPFKPWFASSVALEFDASIVQGQPPRTWTPLSAPGAELLGPTRLPEAPPLPGILPGAPADPVLPSSEILPGENPGGTGAIIPGFGGSGDLPAPGLVNNEPAENGETGSYYDLERRSIKDDMDVDHIPAQAALKRWFEKNYTDLSPYEISALIKRAPAVVIPTKVHRKYSETYGGRNTKARQARDAADLVAAVASNVEALRPGLIENGVTTERVEEIKAELVGLLKQYIL